MRLTSQQQDALRRERGIFANEACDRCGKLLGSVRYTRRGEPGEWCSELCRDGAAEVERRRGGRPRKYRDARERSKANARYQREFRQRLGCKKNPSQSVDTQGLAGAVFTSSANPLTSRTEGSKWLRWRNPSRRPMVEFPKCKGSTSGESLK